MRLVSALSFYRPAFDEGVPIEDGSFLNPRARLFGVVDGVSEAYSPSNPPVMYDGVTSGTMVSSKFSAQGALADHFNSAENFLFEVNISILSAHRKMRKDPAKGDDVGGASFCVCKVRDKDIKLVFGGDCFAFVKTKDGCQFFSGFDEAAFKVEAEDNKAFASYLQEAVGNKGLAWDFYYSKYRAKRLRTSNKNVGSGGFATLNGDPALKECWSSQRILNPQFVLLGTDGLLPSHKTDPANKGLAEELGGIYSKGGLPAILKWRDESERSLAHVTGWPEASAVELKFS